MNLKRLEVFLEFVVFGIVIGITEDILAIKFATGEPITLKVIGIVILIAFPFAFLGEFVADQVDFVPLLQRLAGRKKPRGSTKRPRRP